MVKFFPSPLKKELVHRPEIIGWYLKCGIHPMLRLGDYSKITRIELLKIRQKNGIRMGQMKTKMKIKMKMLDAPRADVLDGCTNTVEIAVGGGVEQDVIKNRA